MEEIKAAFHKCHKRIWKREALLATAAFYEFTKLIFLKLREDERIYRLVRRGTTVTLSDLHFHTKWIDQQSEVSPNPINSILFRQLTDDLAEQVRKKKKKPIFAEGEQIKLKPSTIRSVVELLQNYDLHGIDVDLNGRMFQVFLSAAVRGKNLGAFFTPRNIVELMVGMCSPSITREQGRSKIDMVLDGCCGSGGFLIDAMAHMLDEIHTNPNLSAHARGLKKRLLAKHLFGIESNGDIARIARINMFLHGDGGSRIFRADTLDKEFHVEEGDAHTSRDEITELKRCLAKKGIRFDVVLTNPPFASTLSSTDEHEKRILDQYTGLQSVRGAKAKKSAKSNVLFLARYHDLLRPGGRMAIVMDNSMLNSHNFADYRYWLLQHFILRAVVALPKYSFIQAGAGGVTSILYIEKRSDENQQQPQILARNVHYTGISKSGKEITENDLPDVLQEWRQFEKTGQLFLKGVTRITDKESDELFLINPNEITDRIDVAYHTPSYSKLVKRIDSMSASGTHNVRRIGDFELASKIDVGEVGNEVFKYVDIGAIDHERCVIMPSEIEEGTIDDLPDRARIQIRENDVIFPLSFDSLGKVAIVPIDLDGQLASTGLVAIHNKNYDEAVLLWSVIRSEVMQKQFRHVASGYTQREISTKHLNELRFPIPTAESPKITQTITQFLSAAGKSRREELSALAEITSLMDTVLGNDGN
jgi:type I restriction enzyme M protein